MWNIYRVSYNWFHGFKIAFMTHKQNHRNKNKEYKHTCNSVVLIKYSTANKKERYKLIINNGDRKNLLE